MSAIERATEHAAQVNANLGFYENRKILEEAAEEFLAPLIVAYVAATVAAERVEILKNARAALSSQLLIWDEEFRWDFPDKADNVEDTILWLYGMGKAATVLTGSLRNAFPVDELRERLGYNSGRAG